MKPRREGFTLIELLIVIVIIGILAVISVSFMWDAKDRGLRSTMQSDLRALATHQEMYFDTNLQYASDIALISSFHTSSGVQIAINYAASDGWAAVATHASLPSGQCGLFVGDADAADAVPATQAGVVTCSE